MDYKFNGNTYNLSNIRQYMDKDYWDADDLKFDIWFRLLKHQDIINKVMELNGMVSDNFSGNDNTYRLKQKIIEENRKIEPIEINLDFNWGDE